MFTASYTAPAEADISTVRVINMKSPSTGKPVSNQFVVESDRYSFYQSYKSLIGVYDKKKRRITLGTKWDYSHTTLKYLHKWLESDAFNAWAYIRDEYAGRTLSETIRKAIDAGAIFYDYGME